MDFDEYETLAKSTATYEGKQAEYQLMYLTIGIAGETGEIAEKVKKILRNDDGVISEEMREALKHEVGDVLWYLSQFSRLLGFSVSEAAEANLKKIADRRARNVIKSTGDNR